jgi:hypothetical protein
LDGCAYAKLQGTPFTHRIGDGTRRECSGPVTIKLEPLLLSEVLEEMGVLKMISPDDGEDVTL